MILGYDYETKTTFWQDFTIAEHFGIEAVKETYSRAFKEWKSNYIYLTELVMVLNHKIWQHWHTGNNVMERVYDELWRKAEDYATSHLKDDELEYYLNTLD